VKKRHPSVQKISFVGHSLGGLIARYAIARLYERDITKEISHETGNCKSDESEDKDNCVQEKSRGTIAGLEPMNFITSATPHLGSRFHKQVIRLFFIDAFTVKSLV
jgi:alpha/beta superfamily hydrolase